MLGFDFSKMKNFKHFERNYSIEGTLGSGGFANVYKVKSKLDNRIYALKVIQIKPRHLKIDINEHLQRMLAETKVLSTLRHPNIVKYYGCWVQLQQLKEVEPLSKDQTLMSSQDTVFQMVLNQYQNQSSQGIYFVANDSSKQANQTTPKCQTVSNIIHQDDALHEYNNLYIYILTQFCEQNLHSYIYQRNINLGHRKLDPLRVIQNYKMISNMIDGIEYLHSKKIIHRDIKLQNIIVDQNKKCKIIDYGLAKKVRLWNSINEPGDVMSLLIDDDGNKINGYEKYSSSVGTKIYSSPEQATSEIYDHRTDIFSLALVIALMFSTFSTAHQERQILFQVRNKNFANIQIPDDKLKDILVRCLGEEKQRPTSSQISKCIKSLIYQTSQNRNIEGMNIMTKGKYQYHLCDGQLIRRIPIISKENPIESQNQINQ